MPLNPISNILKWCKLKNEFRKLSWIILKPARNILKLSLRKYWLYYGAEDFFTNNFSAQDYWVCYAYDRNTGIRINLSSKLAKDITDPWGNPFTGTVTMVDKNNEAYQHILVDTTTLGA